MRSALAALSLGLVSLVTAVPPPLYTFDLDDPAADRLRGICGDHESSIAEIYAEIERVITESGWSDFLADAGKALTWLPHADEIHFYAECTGTDVNVAAAANLVYLFLAQGSPQSDGLGGVGVVAASTVQPSNIHGVSFDMVGGYPALASLFRGAVVDVLATKQAALAYRGTTVAGFVYFCTGMAGSGAFSVQANVRLSGTVAGNIAALAAQAMPADAMVRRVLEGAYDYESAVELLATEEIASATYYILSGASGAQGVALARNRTDVAEQWPIGDRHEIDGVVNPSAWYLIQGTSDISELSDIRVPDLAANLSTGSSSTFTDATMESLLGTVQSPDTIYQTVINTKSMTYATQSFTPRPPAEEPPPAPSGGHSQVLLFVVISVAGVALAGVALWFVTTDHRKKVAAIKAMLSRNEAKQYSTFFEDSTVLQDQGDAAGAATSSSQPRDGNDAFV
ncbi:hypothetical protein DIPPA_34252 [Diplonema papillatum]|nr:hypothetical protein DIPPA_34252 [Diplonema papillatum]